MIVPISIVIPIINSNNSIEVWVQKRESGDDLHGKLEFPGGKVEGDETPVTAGAREVLEETGVKVSEAELVKFKNYDFSIGDKTILLMVHLYYDLEERFDPKGRYPLQSLSSMENEIPPKNKEILVDLLEYFR